MARQGINDRKTIVPDDVKRPVDILFQGSQKEEEELVRCTYYLTPVMKRSIDTYALALGKNKSIVVRDIIEKGIPEEIMEEAKAWLEANSK